MSMSRRLAGTIVLTAGTVGCAAARTVADGADTVAGGRDSVPVVTLERSGCRGTCPMYAVQMHADGRVLFTGSRFVRPIGVDSARVAPAAIGALQQAFVERHFAQLPAEIGYGTPSCGSYATDLPTVTLSLRAGDRTHRVRFDEGCRGHPALLDTLARMVDSISGTSRWTHKAGD